MFPLKPRDKVPATTHGVKDATTDEATIREWWAKTPNANIGFATGDGIVVVDIDELGAWTTCSRSASRRAGHVARRDKPWLAAVLQDRHADPE